MKRFVIAAKQSLGEADRFVSRDSGLQLIHSLVSPTGISRVLLPCNPDKPEYSLRLHSAYALIDI